MIDKSLSYDACRDGRAVEAADGWRYERLVPETDLVLGAHGAATIVQDDLDNTYQKID